MLVYEPSLHNYPGYSKSFALLFKLWITTSTSKNKTFKWDCFKGSCRCCRPGSQMVRLSVASGAREGGYLWERLLGTLEGKSSPWSLLCLSASWSAASFIKLFPNDSPWAQKQWGQAKPGLDLWNVSQSKFSSLKLFLSGTLSRQSKAGLVQTAIKKSRLLQLFPLVSSHPINVYIILGKLVYKISKH